MDKAIRVFEGGASRNSNIDPVTGLPKLSYAGFFCPRIMKRRANYMNRHRLQEDGSYRSPRNWRKGLPSEVCMESAYRHFLDVWNYYEGDAEGIDIQDALCGAIFNLENILRNEILGVKYYAES